MTETDRLREALLPCPFCGGTPMLHDAKSRTAFGMAALIECAGCCAEITAVTDEAAIAHWNSRAAPPAAERGEWQPIETALDDPEVLSSEREILLLTSFGETRARFCAGDWADYPEGREYNGAVWSCCDDTWQIEIEETSKDRRE